MHNQRAFEVKLGRYQILCCAKVLPTVMSCPYRRQDSFVSSASASHYKTGIGLWGGKFPEIYYNLFGNFRKFVNCLCQSVVSKSSIAKRCCKISMFLTNNSPHLCALTLCIMFGKKLVLVRLPGISANSIENYRRNNFQGIANISRNFRKIFGNIKFPENLQP